MSNTVYQPGLGNTPFGNQNTNPQSSFYAQESGFSPVESNLIAKAIKYAIFDAAPAQYDSMKVLFSKPYMEKGSDEFEYLEHTFGRSPLEAATGAAAQGAVPGATQTHSFDLTAASLSRISVDYIIIYQDGTKGTVTDITGSTITVSSLTGAALPTVNVGDVFAVQSTVRADGMDVINSYERLDTITRYNYIQLFLRARRWARMEMQKYINQGTTDYLNRDKAEKVKQLRYDMFNSFWNGNRGEVTLANGMPAKTMGGIYPTMVAANSASANPTPAGLQAVFEALLFQTNYKSEGGTRFMYGTDEVLHEFSKIYKQPGLRYEPNNEIANLKLKRIEIGTQNIVLVPCELWREESCFEAAWARRVIVLDQDTVRPVKMRGIPSMEMGQTDNMKRGSREDYTDFWCKAQLSLEFNNPIASFSMDIQ